MSAASDGHSDFFRDDRTVEEVDDAMGIFGVGVECVTITMVVPSSFSWVRSCITSSPLAVSRLPVGSSARISLGARPRRGRWRRAAADRRTVARQVPRAVADLHTLQRLAHPRLALAGRNILVIEKRQTSTFSHTFSSSTRLKLWKMNPRVFLRSSESCRFRTSRRCSFPRTSIPPTRGCRACPRC